MVTSCTGAGVFGDGTPLPQQFKDLFDNYDWMKKKIDNRPQWWHLASPRLEDNRNLFWIGLKYSKNLPNEDKPTTSINITSSGIFTLPDRFKDNRELVQMAWELRTHLL